MVEFIIERNTVTFESKKDDQLEVVQQSLSVAVPGAFYSQLYKDKKWDGRHKFYNSKNLFYSGLLGGVLATLNKVGIKYKLVSLDDPNTKVRVTADMLNPILHEHQKEAILKFFSVNYGILKIPTRGGKTFTASEAIRLVTEHNKKATVAFFVDTTDLFDQATRDISSYLKINPEDIGQLKGSDTLVTLKQINVLSIQTVVAILFPTGKEKKTKEQMKIRNRLKRILTKFLNNVSFAIIDEYHEHSSDKRLNSFKKMKSLDYLMCISATPLDSDNKINNMNLIAYGNDIIYEVPENVLVERGVLSKSICILIVFNNHSGKVEEGNLHIQFENLVLNDDNRNKFICELLDVLYYLELKTLVLFNSKKHGHLISSQSNFPFICGDDNLKVRNEAKNTFLVGKGKVLMASGIYKKGVTLPEVEVLLNVNGGKQDSIIIQRKGRVLGTTKTKDKAIILDVIDEVANYFGEHSIRRIETYQRLMGDENLKVLEASDKDFFQDFKNLLIDWFEI